MKIVKILIKSTTCK